VKFSEWTHGRMLRSPVFQRQLADTPPESCRVEKHPPVASQAEGQLPQYPFLSNLSKVFWPDEGYTKEDLLKYYYRVSPVLIRYLDARPMNLERYPDGIGGKSFYQKDTPDHFPDWIKTTTIKSENTEGKENRYVVCDTQETLVYLANLACIPLHPWSSRISSIDNPDFVILDLDPDPKIPFAQVCQFALKIRDVLEQLQLQSFPKTSGSKGIHILIPIQPEYPYPIVRHFAEIVARMSVHGLREVATIERSMERRKGRIYVDYLQNGKGKTVVSPYCLRPRPGAPVSTPLTWDEVSSGVRPDTFNIKSIFRRLESKGDLFEPLLTQKQSLHSALQRLEDLLRKTAEPEDEPG
jgi:bifunctional non-homologous end joining protein LigD